MAVENMPVLDHHKRARAFGKAYGGLASHFRIPDIGNVIIVAKDAAALQAIALNMGVLLDIGMAAPVLVFADSSAVAAPSIASDGAACAPKGEST